MLCCVRTRPPGTQHFGTAQHNLMPLLELACLSPEVNPGPIVPPSARTLCCHSNKEGQHQVPELEAPIFCAACAEGFQLQPSERVLLVLGEYGSETRRANSSRSPHLLLHSEVSVSEDMHRCLTCRRFFWLPE